MFDIKIIDCKKYESEGVLCGEWISLSEYNTVSKLENYIIKEFGNLDNYIITGYEVPSYIKIKYSPSLQDLINMSDMLFHHKDYVRNQIELELSDFKDIADMRDLVLFQNSIKSRKDLKDGNYRVNFYYKGLLHTVGRCVLPLNSLKTYMEFIKLNIEPKDRKKARFEVIKL